MKPQWQPGKPHKYGARAVTVDGHRFPSAAEAKRYGELKLLERAGAIEGLELQPRFQIVVEGKEIATYVADFRYRHSGRIFVEDVKGVKTPVYKIKKKLVEALYPGVVIEEIG